MLIALKLQPSFQINGDSSPPSGRCSWLGLCSLGAVRILSDTFYSELTFEKKVNLLLFT